MKSRLSPAAVGMFVIGAAALAVGAFLSFGGANIFAKPSRFLVYFNESVHGLELGAAVKVNGVRMGKVAAINVRYDQAKREALVQTICELDRNVLLDPEGKVIDLSNPGVFQDLIDRGMRARLNLQGITGLLFIELDFEDPRKYPANPRFMTEMYPAVPAIPSPISEVQSSIIEIVADIRKVDFAGLGRELKTLLATTNTRVQEFDAKGMSEQVRRTATAVEQLGSSPEARQVITNLNAAIGDLRQAVARIDGEVGPAGAELRRTLADAQAALKTVDAAAAATRQFVDRQGDIGDETTRALRQLAEAAGALERLASFLDRNPNALLVGKKKEPKP